MNPEQPSAKAAVSLSNSGHPLTTPMTHEATEAAFSTFINIMPGVWDSERTYHYMTSQPSARESSQTTFFVDTLNSSTIEEVLRQNEASMQKGLQQWQLGSTYGFKVSFRTRMANSDELVIASTNLAFVPYQFYSNGIIRGNYFRDVGYEERVPTKAQFIFDAAKLQLVMTTYYTRVVSVDTITLINPDLRLRNIVNYNRPQQGAPLSEAVLVGFGVELRNKGARLVP